MFLLNHHQILDYVNRRGQKFDIDPFDEDNLQHASYYFRLGSRYQRRTPMNDREIMVTEGRDPYLDVYGELEGEPTKSLALQQNEYVLVQSLEHFRFDETIFAIFGAASTAARSGIQIVNSPFVDPLYPSRNRSEPLLIGMRNLNPDPVTIRMGERIGKIAFFDISDTYLQGLRPGSSQEKRFRD